ncbi:adenine phosphoribosyltransferase [Halorubellus sp. JP-L1]|uniref:adenine phosphoribosyltransferase n=1 Tax=Halorubellus sp. JP-L1 TaxID=2715753 RepID=UPI00140A9C63|nr:adenine phosphoribosyltransferase [Halorubellus sp. JP-L1]NHN41368.1 adenine phosphoribosyltransferase [Halorubellus sp. JP-L1]
MQRLRQSVHDAPVVERDGYRYLVHPVSNGIPTLDPRLMREVVNGLLRLVDFEDADVIVTPVTMGVHVATALSLTTDVPLVVIRSREYGFDDEVPFEHPDGQYYLNDVTAGDRVVVVDDLVNTGQSIAAVVEALDDVGAELLDVACVLRRVDSRDDLAAVDVKRLLDVAVTDDGVEIVDE